MVKQLAITGTVLALVLTGCRGETVGKDTAAQPDRPETTWMEFTVAGTAAQEPAALYTGDGYSIYIPEDGWKHWQETDDRITEDTWESIVNDEVELRILLYPDATAPATKEHFVRECGYVFEDLMGGDLGDPLLGTDEDGDYLGFMAAEGQGGETYVVAWEYPAEAAEDFGVRLPQIASTFEVTK